MPIGQSEVILRRLSEGSASAAEIERILGHSQSSVSRLLRALVRGQSIVRIGSTRGARYALRRSIEGIGSQWTLRRVVASGRIDDVGTLYALAGTEYYFNPSAKSFVWSGVSNGLPYFLQDQRPAGYMGRAVPRRYPELNLPQRVVDWTDDHYLRYLTQRGADTVGDLILGDRALDDYLALSTRREIVRADERAQRYPQLVRGATEGALPGSSAHGEHPKFATVLADANNLHHVLVKFSPPIASPVGQRWSDLLVAEHLAHEVLRGARVNAAVSRVHRFAERTYLEVERFDRVGLEGRSGVTSLLAVDAFHYGQLDHWCESAARLHRDSRIDDQTLATVQLVATFGSLIANTDQHFGNLSFFDQYDGRFRLAPIYDMLPMLFAPEHDQVSEQVFAPPGPTSRTLHIYARAHELAQRFWMSCANDERISAEFRRVCAACAESLQALPRSAFGRT
jgi:DNA-binding transcriptional ArsR family regulator